MDLTIILVEALLGIHAVAPEVYRRKGYDYKVDIFSIGVVTFTLSLP